MNYTPILSLTFTDRNRAHGREIRRIVVHIHDADPQNSRPGQLGYATVLGYDRQLVRVEFFVVQPSGRGHYARDLVDGESVVGVAAADLVVDGGICGLVRISCRHLYKNNISRAIKCWMQGFFFFFFSLIMPWSHLHIKACPVRAMLDNFREIEWDEVILWKL